MNDRDIDSLLEAARLVADHLAVESPVAAEVIRRLCRSRSAALETNRRLWADNAALRAELDPLRGRRP